MYLNKKSRETLSIGWQMAGIIESQINYLSQKGRKNMTEGEKERLKNLKTSYTFLNKYLDAWTREIDDKEITRIMKYVETTKVILKDDYTARFKMDRWDQGKKQANVLINLDLWENLLGRLIEQDGGCHNCTRDPGVCELFEALMKYDVPSTTEEPNICRFELP